MKKILLLCAMAVMSLGAFAQRNIDLEVAEIQSPTEIRHQTPINVRWLMRNLGPDQIQTGDSLFYRFVVQGNVLPGQGFYAAVLANNINSNDTFGVGVTLPAFNVQGNFTGAVCVQAFILNRGAANPINIEDTAAMDDDNFLCKTDVNFISSGLSTDQVVSTNKVLVKTYPSPANSKLNFELSTIGEGQVTINIFDITGKLVAVKNVSANGDLATETSIDVSDLKSGIYVYEVKFEDFSTSGKVVITH